MRRRRLAGESVTYTPQGHAIELIDHFLESLSLDTIDPTAMERRLIRLCHASDDVWTLERDAARIPPAISGWQPPPTSRVALALGVWLAAASDQHSTADPAACEAIHNASARLSKEQAAADDRPHAVDSHHIDPRMRRAA